MFYIFASFVEDTQESIKKQLEILPKEIALSGISIKTNQNITLDPSQPTYKYIKKYLPSFIEQPTGSIKIFINDKHTKTYTTMSIEDYIAKIFTEFKGLQKNIISVFNDKTNPNTMFNNIIAYGNMFFFIYHFINENMQIHSSIRPEFDKNKKIWDKIHNKDPNKTGNIFGIFPISYGVMIMTSKDIATNLSNSRIEKHLKELGLKEGIFNEPISKETSENIRQKINQYISQHTPEPISSPITPISNNRGKILLFVLGLLLIGLFYLGYKFIFSLFIKYKKLQSQEIKPNKIVQNLGDITCLVPNTDDKNIEIDLSAISDLDSCFKNNSIDNNANDLSDASNISNIKDHDISDTNTNNNTDNDDIVNKKEYIKIDEILSN